MNPGKQKVLSILDKLKKLPLSRRKYWLQKLYDLQITPELGAITTDSYVYQADWLLDLANTLEDVYTSATGTKDIDEAQLAIANKVDNIYTAVSDEVKSTAKEGGKAVGGVFESAFKQIGEAGALPYLAAIGGIAALIYLTKR